MSQQQKEAEKILSECRELFNLRKDKGKYEEKISNLTEKFEKTSLVSMIEPIVFKGYLRITLGNKIARMNIEEFNQDIEQFLEIKTKEYYFHMPEFRDFPAHTIVGYGEVITFANLPKQVKDRVRKSHEEKGIVDDTMIKNMMDIWIAEQTITSAAPEQGHWIKIISTAISPSMIREKAFLHVEDSLDILRLLKRLPIRSPIIAFTYDSKKMNRTQQFSQFNLHVGIMKINIRV